jgi:hypothetical protein
LLSRGEATEGQEQGDQIFLFYLFVMRKLLPDSQIYVGQNFYVLEKTLTKNLENICLTEAFIFVRFELN